MTSELHYLFKRAIFVHRKTATNRRQVIVIQKLNAIYTKKLISYHAINNNLRWVDDYIYAKFDGDDRAWLDQPVTVTPMGVPITQTFNEWLEEIKTGTGYTKYYGKREL
jgi:hypothetical protein